jgi:hypothetical protein
MAGNAAQIAIAMMSKTMFKAIKRVSILCGLAPKNFDVYYQTPSTYSFVFEWMKKLGSNLD